MHPSTSVLLTGFMACLATSVCVFGAEPIKAQPNSAQPTTLDQNVEQRLDRLELELRLIQQHLGLRFRLPLTTGDADATTPDAPRDDDRIGRLEREARRIDDRLVRLQNQLAEREANTQLNVSSVGQGRLVVQNLTGIPRYLSVNKVQYVVQPGRTDIWVPHQAVEAYLPSYELPKLLGMSFWRWTGRDYVMPLEIRN